MRADKFTTRFQEALGEAQSLALARDNPYIEPAHVLAAMLAQDDGPRALLQRAGVNIQGLKTALDGLMAGLPQVSGSGQTVQAGRDLVSLLQAAEIERVCRAYPHLSDDAFVAAHLDEWLNG